MLQTDRQTDELTFAFLELLSEPKKEELQDLVILSSVGFLERHLTLAGSSKMAETMYAQLLRFSEQANFVTADRKILDAKIYQFTN